MQLAAVKNLVMEASRKSRKRLEGVLGDAFEERGILNSEMLAACSVAEALGAEVIIESGRWKGQSTGVLARYFSESGIPIESIEAFWDKNARYVEARLSHFPNLVLHYGDANVLIPQLVRKHRDKKIAILLDGPKGAVAINLFRLALTCSPKIVAGFFHDMRRSGPKTPSEGRTVMERQFPNAFYTDDKDFVAEFGGMDSTCEGTWEPYAINGRKLGSYGPTIGVVIPAPSDVEDAMKRRRTLTLNTLFPRARLMAYKAKSVVNGVLART